MLVTPTLSLRTQALHLFTAYRITIKRETVGMLQHAIRALPQYLRLFVFSLMSNTFVALRAVAAKLA